MARGEHIKRGSPGCTCGEPPFAPPEPSDDCPYHGRFITPREVYFHSAGTGGKVQMMVIHHDKGASIYYMHEGFWIPMDGPSLGAMEDLLEDLS